MSKPESSLEHKLVPVSIESGRANIHMIISNGASRASHQPTAVFVSGLGSFCLGFSSVMRRLAAAGISTVAYDRPGVGRSGRIEERDALQKKNDEQAGSPSAVPAPRYAPTIAEDLEAVLSAAGIPPPYVLVAHSYGGVIAREFLQTHSADVLGVVLIDANCQNAADRHIDVKALEILLSTGEVDFYSVSGLNATHKLRSEEWDEITGKKNPPPPFSRAGGGAVAEAKVYKDSCRGLARLNQYEKHVLGRKPISVIRGNTEAEIRKLLDAADKNKVGSEEARVALRRGLEGMDTQEARLQRNQLQLSEPGSGRMLDVRDSGHHIYLSHPEIITDEIKWVLTEVEKRGILDDWKTKKDNSHVPNARS